MSLKKKLLNLGVLASIGTGCLFPQIVRASDSEDLEKKTESNYEKTNYLELGANLFGAYASAVFIHEGGHYLAFRSAGDKNPRMNFIPELDLKDKRILFAYVQGVSNLERNPAELSIGYLSGVAATRVSYEIFNIFMEYDKVPRTKFLSTSALFLRMDLPRYVLTSSLKYFFNVEQKGDISNLIDNLFEERYKPYAYIGALAGTAVDLYFDLDEIENHFYNALTGRNEKLKRSDLDKINFNLDIDSGGIIFRWNYDF